MLVGQVGIFLLIYMKEISHRGYAADLQIYFSALMGHAKCTSMDESFEMQVQGLGKCSAHALLMIASPRLFM